jgi:hypothetical protein
VVEVALSGNLGFVPLDEVLRLLMRSDQRGAVEIRGEDIRGRIFIGKKGNSLATTAEDRDLHKHLVNSGYVDDTFLRRVVTGESTFADLGEREGQVVDLIREITVESLYKLKAKGVTFEVAEEATSAYGSPRPFELEAALDEAKARAEEWKSVHEVIADLDSQVRMNRDPGDRERIEISREAWRLLCEIGAGASVKSMAERLGTTEFWVARVAADMAEQELLTLTDATVVEEPAPQYYTPATVAAEETPADESWWVEPEDATEESADVSEETQTDPEFQPTFGAETEAGVEGPVAEPARDSRFGHFVRATDQTSPADASAGYGQPEGTEPEAAQQVDGATAFEPAADTDETGAAAVEEDTEAFLEKVFSQLEVNGQADVEEEGHGLLRRRRMGSVLKEIDED